VQCAVCDKPALPKSVTCGNPQCVEQQRANFERWLADGGDE